MSEKFYTTTVYVLHNIGVIYIIRVVNDFGKGVQKLQQGEFICYVIVSV